MSLLAIIAVSFALVFTTQAYTIEHMDTDNFDVSVVVDFDPACSSDSDFSIIVSVARGASILNVLEHSNVFITYFQSFKVTYGVHASSYILTSINGESENTTCAWHVSTNPVTSTDATFFPLTEVFVTNVGMTVTFEFTTTTARKPQSAILPKSLGTGPTGTMDVKIEYTAAPCNDPSYQDSTTEINFTLGESALNALEAASEKSGAYTFVAKNTFGSYYTIDTISSASNDGTCRWCEYYKPPNSAEYSLTADINNFVIPITGGDLILRYQTTCGSAALDDFVFKSLTDIHFPIPPHYNPFMPPPNLKRRCNDKEDGEHCRAD